MTSRTALAILVVLCSLFTSAFAADALNYTLVPRQDYDDIPHLAFARAYGVRSVVEESILEHKVPNTIYIVTAVHSVYNATNGTLAFYKFNLTLKNPRGDAIKPVFVVQYNTKTEKFSLKSAHATINLVNSTTSTHSNNTSTGTHSNNTSSGSSGNAQKVLVPASQYNDSTVQSLLLYGVNFVAKQAIASGHIPKTIYRIKTIHSVYKQVLANSVDYEFDVEIQDLTKNHKAEAFYTINYKPASGEKLIAKWNYKVLA